jgi:hypothetical protein
MLRVYASLPFNLSSGVLMNIDQEGKKTADHAIAQVVTPGFLP